MSNSDTLTVPWRPQKTAETAAGYQAQLEELDAHEAEVSITIRRLEEQRGHLLVAGSAEEVSEAEELLQESRREIERIEVMRPELKKRRDACAGRETEVAYQCGAKALEKEVSAVIAGYGKVEQMLRPLLELLAHEKDLDKRIAEFNRMWADRGFAEVKRPCQMYESPYGKYETLVPLWKGYRLPQFGSRDWHWTGDIDAYLNINRRG